MALFSVRSSLFDLSPRVWGTRGQLYARTSLLAQALTLFAVRTFVHVDGAARRILIERRTFWLFRRVQHLRFDRVRHVTYRFASMATSWNYWQGVTDQWESFAVGLALRDPDEEIDLIRFRGAGTVGTGVLGVLLGEPIIDTEGDQQGASTELVDALQKLIGVGLGEPPTVFKDAQRRVWRCRACSRPGPPRPGKCLYCGDERIADA